MRHILVILILLALTGKTLANETITIFVKEASYFIGNSEEELTFEELLSQLKQLKFSLVTLDVDYCADADTIAYAYVAIANSKLEVKDIRLQLSGRHEESQC
jgi:hypothetical protein